MGILNNLFGGYFDRENPSIERGQQRKTFDEKKASPIAIIYKSELEVISRFILDYPSIETGGQLFGYWTTTGTPVVLYAIGPGPLSKHNTQSFFQDMDYLNMVGNELFRRYRLQHIGEWHSHHQMDLAHPSGGDVRTMHQAVNNPGFPRMLLCIGNCTPSETEINAFNFHHDDPYNYVHARWDIVRKDSPYRVMIDNELGQILIQPHTRQASFVASMVSQSGFVKQNTSHWLTEKIENVEMMKHFAEEVKRYNPKQEIKTIMHDSGEPVISICNGKNQILFPFGFPEKGPKLLQLIVGKDGQFDGDYETMNLEIEWKYPQLSLKEAFQSWLLSILPTINEQSLVEEVKTEELCEQSEQNNTSSEEDY